ncbi:uncharacterized protein [Montipora capricornis]|uniref:uncharacterized protein n=1 Tax=Montipora capricornis TaxID=246305 RepID=UPI0035F15D35
MSVVVRLVPLLLGLVKCLLLDRTIPLSISASTSRNFVIHAVVSDGRTQTIYQYCLSLNSFVAGSIIAAKPVSTNYRTSQAGSIIAAEPVLTNYRTSQAGSIIAAEPFSTNYRTSQAGSIIAAEPVSTNYRTSHGN